MDSKSILYDGMSKRQRGDYPPTTLAKPALAPFKHLRKCTINQTIQKVNQVVLVLFKQKMKIEEQQIIKLLKFFGVPVPRGNGLTIDLAELKKPDFLQTVNHKMM